MALLTSHWGLVLDGISSDGSTPKGLQSRRFLTKAEPCDESLFDPQRTHLIGNPFETAHDLRPH